MNKTYQHLYVNERVYIQFLLAQGFKVRAIARTVNRAAAAVSLEIGRNGWANPALPRGRRRPRLAGGYLAISAQERAETEARQSRKPRRLRPGTGIWGQMRILLCRVHCPEQISGIPRRMYSDDPERKVSHETIYTAIYAMPQADRYRDYQSAATVPSCPTP